jgi:hypothetical protein
MDDKDYDGLLDNEREWRRFLIRKVESIESEFTHTAREIAAIKVWNIVFRIIGASVFTIVLIWIESKLK